MINDQVIAVNQISTNNKEIQRGKDHRTWIADIPDSDYKHVALFNLSSEEKDISFDYYWVKIHNSKYVVKDLWDQKEVGTKEKVFTQAIEPHGVGLFMFSKKQ